MRMNIHCVRKMARWWFNYQDEAEGMYSTSCIGYPSETAESRYEREGGARGSGGAGRSKVPCKELDGLRMSRMDKWIDKGMRNMPKEYRKALEDDYRGVKGRKDYQSHRRMLNKAVVWWQGYGAHR